MKELIIISIVGLTAIIIIAYSGFIYFPKQLASVNEPIIQSPLFPRVKLEKQNIPDVQSEESGYTSVQDIPHQISQQKSQEDSQIKIEKCKTQAGYDAKNMVDYEARLAVNKLDPAGTITQELSDINNTKDLQIQDRMLKNLAQNILPIQNDIYKSTYDSVYRDRYSYYFNFLYLNCLNK